MADTSSSPQSSQTVGRYQIERELGRGAMGRVYRALDPVIERTVALKTFVLPADGDRDTATRRIVREAKSAAAITHPNIVTIYDVVEHDDGVYIAMELVDGQDLDQVLQGRKLELEESLDLLTQVASALDHLHDKKVVHRDLKPANILLTTDGTVKLTDFGIARPGHLDDPGATTALFATPQYMSHEQAFGDPVDKRSDIFSLGVIAYQMLAGIRPFPAATVGRLIHEITHEPHIPMSRAAPGLPTELEEVFSRALHKKPEKRMQSAGELVRALRRAALPQLIDDTLPTMRIERVAKPSPWRRWLPVAILALLVLGAGVVGFGMLEDADKLDYDSLLVSAQRAIEAGDLAEARLIADQARSLEPDRTEIDDLLNNLVEEERIAEIQSIEDEARIAIAAADFTGAADKLSELENLDVDTTEIQGELDAAIRESHRLRRERLQVIAGELKVELRSEIPEGEIRVLADSRNLLDEEFDLDGSWVGRRLGGNRGEVMTWTRPWSTSDFLQVFVLPDDMPEQSQRLVRDDSWSDEGGHLLTVRLREDGTITVDLQ
ncbi:MAG: protein kinase [Acidobacteriota bacterium]